MSNVNSDLAALQLSLIDTNRELAESVHRTDSMAAKQAALIEMIEVGHRITLVGQQLFSQQTGKIAASMEKVVAGQKALEGAIAEIEKVNKFIETVTRFLGLVDDVIEVAKLI